MRVRRLATMVLGAWLGCSAFMTWVAMQNFAAVTRLLDAPSQQAEAAIEKLGGPEQARLLFRYQVGEQNRYYFEHWELAQLWIGAGLLGLLLFGTHEKKFSLALALGMIAVVAVVHIWVTPPIIGLGRELDFVPPAGRPELRRQFQTYHTTYSTFELVKLGLGMILAAALIRSHGRRNGGQIKEEAA
jgi:hypothetical protein